MQKFDPDFPSLPFISDAEWAAMTREQRWLRHLQEVAESAKAFDAMQAAGVDIFEAAKRVPTPRMNRAGMSQAGLRSLYQDSHN